MTVKEIKPKMFCLEYRQEPGDKDYGSCLYARFMFNLDRYELSIISDCGNYGHKWVETPSHESFLQLMARIDEDYLIRKIYGSENIFNTAMMEQVIQKHLMNFLEIMISTVFLKVLNHSVMAFQKPVIGLITLGCVLYMNIHQMFLKLHRYLKTTLNQLSK